MRAAAVWRAITLVRAVRGSGPGEPLRGMRQGWTATTRHTPRRLPMSWRTVCRLTAAGRLPVVWPSPVRCSEELSPP